MTSHTLQVQGADFAPYLIHIHKDLSDFCTCLKALQHPAKRVCIVTDTNIGPLYAETICQAVAKAGFTPFVYSFKAGEEHKTLDQIRALYGFLIEREFDRKDLLIALGGGVTGDMCGFAAATYLRGIDFIQIPTTLLSMVDSSVGGKTGVDLGGYKNMIGAFHQPRLVYIAVSVLVTLPTLQFSSGMGEVIKHGLIRDAAYFRMLETSCSNALTGDPQILAEIIYRSVRIKAEIVGRDPLEQNERRLLNFGHTVGHAIEKESGFTLTHGQCVAFGCIAAARISAERGLLPVHEIPAVRALFKAYGLSDTLHASFAEPSRILDALKHDKKKQGDTVAFVLLNRIGDAFVCSDVTPDEILSGLSEILQ